MLQLSGDGIFYTIQGEGRTLGYPATFIRLHHCNLTCSWCDAWYTWDKSKPEFHTERSEITTEDAALKILELGCKRLVITGGEPLIQWKELAVLLDLLPSFAIEIETNGTIMPQAPFFDCQFNVSPKLGNSANTRAARLRPNVLKALNKLDSTFKFVVANQTDVEEVIREFTPLVDLDKILLMPLGTDVQTIRQHLQAIAESAKQYGLRITTRLQVDIWGDKRGV